MNSNSLSERLNSIKETISEFRFECVEFEHQLKSAFEDLNGLRSQLEWRCRQVSQLKCGDIKPDDHAAESPQTTEDPIVQDTMLHIASMSDGDIDA